MSLPAEVLELSLDTIEKELKYASSKHAIELVTKDEDMRRMRAELFLVEDDAEELRDQLQHEQETSERIRNMVDEHLVRAQAAEAVVQDNEQELRVKEHEISRLQTENEDLKSTTQNTSTILAEKLALARELSAMKPELEHLRAQDTAAGQLRSEKLTLQRQLSEAQCEIESARAEAKRAQAKRRNTTMEIAQEEQVSDLKKELARERRLRTNAEEMVEQARTDMKIDDIRRELAKEKTMREKLEEEIELLKENTSADDIRRDLTKAQKAKYRLQSEIDNLQSELEKERMAVERAVKRVEGETSADAAVKDLNEELKQEKELQAAAVKAATRREEQLEADKAELEAKLNQFRSKLREKKEELKTTKADLEIARERADKAETAAKTATELASIKALQKNAAPKRNAIPTAPDAATLGTPGDGPKTRRNRNVKPAAIGDKSSFSITPFLNKTSVLAVDEAADDTAVEMSPTVNNKVAKVPLAPAASIKGNRKPRKQAEQQDPKAALSAIVEEDERASQAKLAQQDDARSSPLRDAGEPKKDNAVPKRKQKQKPRKSLTEFKSFQKEEEPVKQKKRKLGGRAPTLFDEEETTEGAKPGLGDRGLFGPAAYAKLASSKKTAAGGVGSSLMRSTFISAADGTGFKFSPLRTRKKLDDTLKA